MFLPDFKDQAGKWVRSKHIDGRHVRTVSGRKWEAICNRCTEGGSLQRDFPAYVGSKNKFESFDAFAEWHRSQDGYGSDYELDKDLLKDGNKVYSPEFCVLIPKKLNLFFGKHTRGRGRLPQGIDDCFEKPRDKVRAQIRVDGKSQHLGFFSEIKDAQAAYIEAKTKYARMYADLYEGTVDERAIHALRTKRFEYRGLDLVFVD